MSVHVGIEQTKIGKFLPIIPGHFREEGLFHMNSFIMGKRQDELLGKSVDQRKGELILMMFSKYRILFKIGESIVHPSHIPLEIESETRSEEHTSELQSRGHLV